MNPLAPLSGSLLIALAVAASAPAADLNNWRSIPAPTGLTGTVDAIGTTASYLTATDAHFYSGITKEWTVFPITSPSFFEQYNAYMVLQDGNQIYGFATRTGTLEVLTASPGATIISGPVSSSWITLVSDGTNAWGFSAFRGKWVPLPVPLSQPNPTMLTRRYCGLIQDGNTVWGFSAHWGTFVPVAADPQTVISVEEETGSAHSNGVFRAFSTHQNTWGVQAFPTGNSILEIGYAIAFSGTSALAFSGLTGTFATATTAAPVAGVANTAMVVAFHDGNDVVCYAAGQGNFARRTAPGALFDGNYEFMMVIEAGQVTPFSSITGGFGPSIPGTFQLSTNEVIAYADGATTDYGYSPILNAWTAVPAVTQVGNPILVRSSVAVPHAGGYVALSARHGTWVAQATTLTNAYLAPSNTSTILLLDNNDAAIVFDTRLNRFAPLPKIGTGPLTIAINRHTVIAHDSAAAYGFGQPTGRWDVLPLTAPVLNLDIASSIGFIETSAELAVYCVQGSLSYDGRFPEFSRAMKLGNVLRMHQVAPAGSAIVSLVGVKPGFLDLGPAGILFMDPAMIITFALPAVVPANGLLDIDLPLPLDPVLIGVQPHIQDIVLPPSAPAYLSTSIAPVLY